MDKIGWFVWWETHPGHTNYEFIPSTSSAFFANDEKEYRGVEYAKHLAEMYKKQGKWGSKVIACGVVDAYCARSLNK